MVVKNMNYPLSSQLETTCRFDVDVLPVFMTLYQHFEEASKKVTPSLDSILGFLEDFDSNSIVRFIASTSQRRVVARIGDENKISNLNYDRDGLHIYTFDPVQYVEPIAPDKADRNWKHTLQEVCPTKINQEIIAGVLDYIRFAPLNMPYASFLSKQGPVND